MADQEVRRRVQKFMDESGYRRVRIASLVDRYARAIGVGSAERVIAACTGEGAITVQRRAGDWWLLNSSLKVNKLDLKSDDLPVRRKRAA